MVKIVNGVIVGNNAAEGESSETEATNSNSIVTVFGYDLTSWHIGGICFLGWLLGGFGLLLFIGGGFGLLFLCKKGNALNPNTSNNGQSGIRPGQARVMGVSDLPKPPAKC